MSFWKHATSSTPASPTTLGEQLAAVQLKTTQDQQTSKTTNVRLNTLFSYVAFQPKNSSNHSHWRRAEAEDCPARGLVYYCTNRCPNMSPIAHVCGAGWCCAFIQADIVFVEGAGWHWDSSKDGEGQSRQWGASSGPTVLLSALSNTACGPWLRGVQGLGFVTHIWVKTGSLAVQYSGKLGKMCLLIFFFI